jgi:hypothetical protein
MSNGFSARAAIDERDPNLTNNLDGVIVSAVAGRFLDDLLTILQILEVLRRERHRMVVIGSALDVVRLALAGIEIGECDGERVTVVIGDGDVDVVHAVAVALPGGRALGVITPAGSDDEGDGGTCDTRQKRFAVQHGGRSPSLQKGQIQAYPLAVTAYNTRGKKEEPFKA